VEEVSSIDDACSALPSASCWLDEDNCPDADVTCSAVSCNPSIILLSSVFN
jgi:hypothetical protein